MRRFIVIASIIAFGFTQPSCGTSKEAASEEQTQLTMKGKIDVAGTSTYMYGTHKFYTDDTFYAIRSDNYKLDDYVGKTVTIVYKKREGYPIDNGPEYLDILEIIE